MIFRIVLQTCALPTCQPKKKRRRQPTDLEKFRSFQKPNRIDVLEKKTRHLGAGPGVAGSVAESGLGPEAKKGR